MISVVIARPRIFEYFCPKLIILVKITIIEAQCTRDFETSISINLYLTYTSFVVKDRGIVSFGQL